MFDKKIAFIFPGQGSQKIGMGKDLYENFSEARDIIDEVGDKLKIDFKKLLFEENEDILKTEFIQPAIFVVSMMAHNIFKKHLNIKAEFSLGHSLGEFSALCSVGALNLVDGAYLVHQRGLLMKEACSNFNSTMSVVLGLEDKKIEELCENLRKDAKEIWPANYNCEGQLVVAGLKKDLEYAQEIFKKAGAKKFIFVNMNVASHCPLLENIKDKFGVLLDKYLKDDFNTKVISNVTAKAYNTKDQALKLLKDQLTKAVKYKQSILNYHKEVEIMIEFGNSNVLKGLNKKIASNINTLNISDTKSLEECLKEIKG